MSQIPDTGLITFQILNSTTGFSAAADMNTGRPTLTGGGAKWNTIDRPQRTGLTIFGGYDPLQISIPLLFDSFDDDQTVQDDVDLLWFMWGRGPKAANTSAGSKAPSAVGVTGALMPPITQTSGQPVLKNGKHASPPNWVVTGIDEDGSSAVTNSASHIVRLAVVVTLEEYETTTVLASLTEAAPTSRVKTNVYPKDTTMRKVATAQQTTVVVLRTLNDGDKKLTLYLRDPSKKFKTALAVKVPRITA